MLKIVESILRRAGYDVAAANSGDAAHEFATAHRGNIGLLVIDHSMNAQGGRNLVDEILPTQSDMKVLRSSGELEGELCRSGELSQNSFFIQKPFTSQQLIEKVRTIIGPA